MIPKLPQILISVRNASEAAVASRYPIEIIDLKNPSTGSLGIPATEVIAEFVQADASARTGSENTVASLRSIALGELVELDWSHANSSRLLAGLSHFQFAKVGLAGTRTNRSDWRSRWHEIRQALSSQTCLVGVAYADWENCDAPSIEMVFDLVLEANDHWPHRHPTMLIDTFSKSAGNLVDLIGWAWIEKLIGRARELGIWLVLAGSLTPDHLPLLARLGANAVGFRGAVCDRGRANLSETKLAALMAQLDGMSAIRV